MKSRTTFLCLIIIFLSSINIISQQESRPKIGLVLSGGGARGLAHVGTLKLIDSLEIPIDYIAGTSMGGIIGALYASGFTGNEIEKYVLSTDWNEMFLDKPPRSKIPFFEKKDDAKYNVEFGIEGFTPVIPSGLIGGQNISLKFADLTSAVGSITDFDKLPIPYRCVAIDLITGSEVVLKKGSLPKAMRSTMAIPSVFSPVEWGDSLLIDGGFINNFPADVLEEMGANIIIGVNVGTTLLKREQLKSLIGVLQQTMVLTDYARVKENIKKCEILIQPDLNDFTTADFDADNVCEIIKRGELAAAAGKNKLLDLKKRYVSQTDRLIEKENLINNPKVISSISLAGESSYTLRYLYELTGHKPNDILDIIKLEDKVAAMKVSGLFEDVEYDVIDADNNKVMLYFKLTEKIPPVIYGLSIEGNKNLHFDFIMDILGIKPGDPFDKEKLKEQIMYMSSLGYFEEITYMIEPVKENYIHLTISLKEKPMRELKLGFRYDDKYKIVGILGLQTTNLPFIGFRGEASIQFAGLFRFDYMALYPSRTLNFPLYPYLRVSYKDVPVDIYDFYTAEKMAEYNDKSWLIGIGVGHVLQNMGAIRIEYHHEYPDINPNLTGLDPNFYPSWKHNLRVIQSDIIIDLLDNPLTPREGVFFKTIYEFSSKALGSELDYRHYQLEGKIFSTFAKKHTFGLSGYYTNAKDDFPIYKWPIKGGTNTFIGMKIGQIEGYNFGYVRIDYRYEFKKDIFFKIIINAGNYNIEQPGGPMKFTKPFYGFGAGIKFLSIIGPFELIFSKGSKSVYNWSEFKPQVYFTAGFEF